MSQMPTCKPSLRTIAMPADANPDGDIFGGWIMSQMDLASGVFAAQEVKGRVVTVAVDAMTFHKPVYIGDDVSCYCRLVRHGNTSLVVLVETWVQRHHSEQVDKVTEAQFTFVAIDAEGRPRPVNLAVK
ncbi:acyl-CoA thioesterase [Amphritea atlantica]|nr:acyl-CoA thioesterase [Amphritea atlantica]